MTSFCCIQVSFIRSCGKYSPSNFDVKNIDLYNIIMLRSIDVITLLQMIISIIFNSIHFIVFMFCRGIILRKSCTKEFMDITRFLFAFLFLSLIWFNGSPLQIGRSNQKCVYLSLMHQPVIDHIHKPTSIRC